MERKPPNYPARSGRPLPNYRNQPQRTENPFLNYAEYQNNLARSEGLFPNYRNQPHPTENPFLDYSEYQNNPARSEGLFLNYRNQPQRTENPFLNYRNQPQRTENPFRNTRNHVGRYDDLGSWNFRNHRTNFERQSQDGWESARGTRRGQVDCGNGRAIAPLGQRLQDLDIYDDQSIQSDWEYYDEEGDDDYYYDDEYAEDEAVQYTDLRTGLPVTDGWKPITDKNRSMFHTNQNRMAVQWDSQRQHRGFTEQRASDAHVPGYINRRTRTELNINSVPKQNIQTEKRTSDITSTAPGYINRRTRTELDINSVPTQKMQTDKRTSDVTSIAPGYINRRTQTELDINSFPKQKMQTEKRTSDVTSIAPDYINRRTRTELDINSFAKQKMQEVHTESSALLVAAIDFGTTYSGWAFSFKHEFEKDPIKISAKVWNSGESLSLKAPTCILINPDGETIDSFGYEAESKYAELALEESHKEWYFFKRFKMMLFNRVGIKRNMVLKDATGKQLPAKTVFMLALKYLKDDLIKTSSKRLGESKISDDDIRWVLTVPAIWDDAAKQFMREAAQDAGIAHDKLMICLEPEAASIYCRHLPVEKNKGKEQISLKSFTAGEKYMILDAGGGTVDITVHEIMQNGKLRELHKATGGAWGGTKVDEAFEQLLENVFGKTNVKKFKDHHMDDYIDLFRQLELKKREISPSKDTKVTIRVACSLIDIVEKQSKRKIKEYLQQSTYKDTMSITGEKLRMDANIARSCFSTTIDSIINHVAKLLEEPSVVGCSAILMVGGFSDSPMLHEAIQDRFGQLTTIIPEEAELVVLKGAVIYGHDPKTVAERISNL